MATESLVAAVMFVIAHDYWRATYWLLGGCIGLVVTLGEFK
jgi:hypothetical protein